MALDLEAVEAFAIQTHANFEICSDHLEHAHPRKIVKRVDNLLTRYRNDNRKRETPGIYAPDLAKASWMLYAMELWGLDFEGVCDKIDYSPAMIVTKATMDMRLPKRDRYIMLRSQIAEGGPAVQLLRLAEIWAVCDRFLEGRDNFEMREALAEWLPAADHWLMAIPLCRRRGVSTELYKAAAGIRHKMVTLDATYLSGRRPKLKKTATPSKARLAG